MGGGLTVGLPPAGLVLDWAAPRLRDLPWRHTRDPWAVLVSELMLQQTQVARVVGRYETFMRELPDAPACAAASVGDVVRAWHGLGYNRRAVNLHRAATAIAAAGAFPCTLDGLLALPGVGPYTARAVLAFAFEADAAVVDTNVARVVARVVGRPLRAVEAQATADSWLPNGKSWAWNQAVMDLGATVCTARAPACGSCPIAAGCAWRCGRNAPPDPAIGSAGVSGGQSRFAGSDRQGRGRLVDALRTGPVPADRLAVTMGWRDDAERAQRVAAGVVRDGLARVDARRGFVLGQ